MFIELTTTQGSPLIVRHDEIAAMTHDRDTAIYLRGCDAPLWVRESLQEINSRIRAAMKDVEIVNHD